MKDFFSLKITNKKLIPALLLFLLIFFLSYYFFIYSRTEPEIIADQAPAKPTAEPQKEQTIMVYPSRDPFKPLVEIKEKKEAEVPEDTPLPLSSLDLSELVKNSSPVNPVANSGGITLQGIITSNNQSSALLHMGNKVLTASIGDIIPGYGKITAITGNQIILKNETGQTVLTVGG